MLPEDREALTSERLDDAYTELGAVDWLSQESLLLLLRPESRLEVDFWLELVLLVKEDILRCI